MGFRNLRSFNLALLEKQGWRLLTKPDTLVSRIFKARYYPQGFFFTSDIGHNPSYVWRSVLEAHPLVLKGVRWTVGDGTSISILGEPWLPDAQNPFVSSQHPALSSKRVCNLLVLDGSGWDEEVVVDLFEQREQRLILQIPVQYGHDQDKITWIGEVLSLFTVKSAHRMMEEMNGENTHDAAALEVFWKKFWALKLPPKMKNLVWRACQGCLPTMIQLRTKRVHVSTICLVCDSHEESIYHALVDCPTAQLCWNREGIVTVLQNNADFLDWCNSNFLVLDSNKKKRLVALCWSIWNARNDKVWNNKLLSAESIVYSAKIYLNQWLVAHSYNVIYPSAGFVLGDGAEQRQPPLENSIKVNVDGAIFADTNQFGVGFVVHNTQGLLIEGVTKLFQVPATPEFVEALGVKEALSWIKRNRSYQVAVETDCLVFIQALRSSIEMISMFGQVVNDCKVLLKELQHVSVFFVRRSANKVTHNFARASLSYPDCSFNFGSVPINLLPSLVAEFNG
uniref:RNase H type-1 domain-containing protein n=1 Tax=Cannabis sativa TaxID=3483 RepID=A0A803PA05_CANSA